MKEKFTAIKEKYSPSNWKNLSTKEKVIAVIVFIVVFLP
jgi:hypothetical protein